MIPIFLVRYKSPDIEKRCIDVLRKHTDLTRVDPIVFDNGPIGRPLGSVWNQMIRSYECWDRDAVGVLLNTDCFVSPKWIERLSRVIKTSPDYGFVGPVTNNCKSEQRVTANYDPERFRGQVKRDRMLSGFCLMFRREAWASAGGFCEDSPLYGQDTALIWTAMKLGWHTAIVLDCWVEHLGSASIRRAADRGELDYDEERRKGKEWFLQYQRNIVTRQSMR